MVEVKNMLQEVWPEWRIEEEISDGRGHFSSVYKISRNDLAGKIVSALKVITLQENPENESNPDETISEDCLQDIVSEIQIMSSLKGHSNIVSIEDYYVGRTKDGREWIIFIRMELLTPLLEAIDFECITEGEIKKIGADICTALEACGKKNIAHRDIKPENIFKSDLGTYKLGDFGVSRIIEKNVFGQNMSGTPLYMAPEVMNHSFGSYTYEKVALADIYSLGIVLYRLANQNMRLPFEPIDKQILSPSDHREALDKRIRGDKISAPTQVSSQLATVILKACEYDHLDRYQTVTEFRQALVKENVPQNDPNINVKPPRSWKRILWGTLIVTAIIMIYFITYKYLINSESTFTQEIVVKECAHENLRLVLTDGTEYGTGDILEQLPVTGWRGNTFWLCKDCGKRLNGTDQINYQLINQKQVEALDQKWMILRNVDETCEHEHKMSYFVLEDDSFFQLEGNAGIHKQVSSGKVYEYCVLCGENTGVYDATRMDDEPHLLNEENICSECGYLSTCKHELVEPRDEIYELSSKHYLPYDDSHSVSGLGIHTLICMDCGNSIFIKKDENVVIPMEEHHFIDDVCIECGFSRVVLNSKEEDCPIDGFSKAQIEPGQTLQLYATPNQSSVIIETINTEQNLYVAGHDNEWLLVACERTDGSFQTGYIDSDRIKGYIDKGDLLEYSMVPIRVRKNIELQNDPVTEESAITQLETDAKGAFLFRVRSAKDWAYIEVIVEGVRYRGFVPLYSIEQDAGELESMKNAGTEI